MVTCVSVSATTTPRVVARKNRQIYYAVALGLPANSRLNGVMRLDVESGKTDTYSFGDGYSVEEHVVVPRAGSAKEGDGWLVGVGFDVARQQTFASVFDARNLAAGPIALARLPYWVPLCFHGHFHSL